MPKRRRHSLTFKRQVVAAANQPGASIAAVAQEHGINANLLHTWRRQLARKDIAEGAFTSTPLLPVAVLPEEAMTAPTAASNRKLPVHAEGMIDIQFPRVRVVVRGTVDLTVLESTLRVLRPC